MAHGVHPEMHAVQSTGTLPLRDRFTTEAEVAELVKAHDPVLRPRDRGDAMIDRPLPVEWPPG